MYRYDRQDTLRDMQLTTAFVKSCVLVYRALGTYNELSSEEQMH